jgi:hypothetical protein
MQKESLKADLARKDGEHQTAAQEELRLRREVESMKEQIASLQTRYDRACLDAAGNAKGEDPAAIQAEINLHGHRLRGLEQLHKSAVGARDAAQSKAIRAHEELQAHLDREELDKLEQDARDAREKLAQLLKEHQLAIQVARQDIHRTAFALDRRRTIAESKKPARR